jgi:ubiquinone/menaquinone biosynthesis C-methylase UbiE
MNWKYYWNNVAIKASNSLEAVQRKDMESTKLTVSHIVSSLSIDKENMVLDMCCGNGIVTEMMADHCKNIIGIDQSEELIAEAKNNSKKNNVDYILGDVLEASKLLNNKKFDRIYIEFSLQYFDRNRAGEKLLREAVNLLTPSGKIFIGDIPDKKKLFKFYNTIPKLFYLFTGKLRRKNPMGKFWSKRELKQLCAKFELEGTYLKQDKSLPYAWYRFDFLIENKTN